MIRVGVIGLGNIGRRHVENYTRIKGVEIAGIADTDKKAAQKLADEFGIKKVFTDYQDLLCLSDLQAVTISVPPFLHKAVTIAAASEGLHVHCEKPMALTLEDCDAMISTCEQHGVILYISFLPRLMPAYRRIQELVFSGDYGTPLCLIYRRFMPAIPGIWMPPSWFWHQKLGGGLLIENGTHHFDYIRWLMGDVVKVTAEVDTLRFKESWLPYFENPDIEDIGTIILRHKDGAMSTLVNTCIVPAGDLFQMEVATTSHYMELHHNNLLHVEHNGQTVFETVFNEQDIPSVSHFIDCIGKEKKPMVTGEDGRVALEIALAALKSAKEQRAVYLH